MKKSVTLVTLCVFTVQLVLVSSRSVSLANAKAQFNKERDDLWNDDLAKGVGHGIQLTTEEKIVNDYLLSEKRKLMNETRSNMTSYWPAASFYESKSMIEVQKTFSIIKDMPKGSALHLHDIAITSLDWVVHNLTYRDNVWMCLKDGNVILQFSKQQPNHAQTGCQWSTTKSSRSNWNSSLPHTFDEWLVKNISYLGKDPLKEFQTGDECWVRFNLYFSQVINLLFYAPFMREYYYQALVEFHADNVQYIELRSQMSGYFDFNDAGERVVHDAEFGLQLYKSVTEEFKKDHPNFFGTKIIMSGLRFRSVPEILEEVKTSIKLHQDHPDIFLGYDLVGQEDPLNPLEFYLDALLYPSTIGYSLPYFFHSAETNWQGTQVDKNLVDALLLNTTRIGHAFGLIKHPELMRIVMERGIALEVNPISNQLLGLVKDLRNHPMAALLADDYPVVISSDDPGSWEALPLSHDFYLAFMTLSGGDTGLSFLKKLAINSIQYTALTSQEKKELYCDWSKLWDAFIQKTARELSNDASITEESESTCVEVPWKQTAWKKTSSNSATRFDVCGYFVTFQLILCLFRYF